jgi:hypothetical protein
VVTDPTEHDVTVGGQDVIVYVSVVTMVDVVTEAEPDVEIEAEPEEVDEGSKVDELDKDRLHSELVGLSCTVTKRPVPLCSIRTCSHPKVATMETFTAGPSV